MMVDCEMVMVDDDYDQVMVDGEMVDWWWWLMISFFV